MLLEEGNEAIDPFDVGQELSDVGKNHTWLKVWND